MDTRRDRGDPNPTRRGALIVVEGLDRAGKSSQCENLLSYLQKGSRPAKSIRFPDRSTPTGQLIDSYLRGENDLDDHAIHLLFATNRWELAKSIQADIDAGTTLVVDRYSYSGAVYSAAKANPTLSLEWAWQPEVGLPRPDVCIFLNISIEEAAKRGGYGDERYENTAMQSRVRQLFTSMLFGQEDVTIIDAGRSFEEVAEEIQLTATAVLARVNEIGPLRTMKPLSEMERAT